MIYESDCFLQPVHVPDINHSAAINISVLDMGSHMHVLMTGSYAMLSFTLPKIFGLIGKNYAAFFGMSPIDTHARSFSNT